MRNYSKDYPVDWKYNPYKDRAVKCMLEPTPTQIEYLLFMRQTYLMCEKNLLSKLFYDQELIKCIKAPATIQGLPNKYPEAIEGIEYSNWRRSMSHSAIKLLDSHITRNNKMPNRIPNINHNASIRIMDQIVELVDGNTLIFTSFARNGNGKYNKESIKCFIPSGMVHYVPFVKRKSGGNLLYYNHEGNANCPSTKKSKWVLVLRAHAPFKWLYQPTNFVAGDINLRENVFITFSEPVEILGNTFDIWQRPLAATTLEAEIKELNKLISNANKNNELISRQRKMYRLALIRKHQEHARVFEPYIDSLLEYFISNKLGFAIDDISPGGRNGTFGHDKFIKYAIKRCEDLGVPFIRTPSAYSSIRCEECYTIDKQNRKNSSTFQCIKCKHTTDADKHAARNLKSFATFLWANGGKDFKAWRDQRV